ncbi:Ankyrin repeat protein [Mizuhopecten yessoensis]|uniref:Ankyrin repeat protein n=1 Tax=Mizuhopecten yessoensis TaxID=6573 RepID=A0A210QQD9_MIZYE|nr:Ankyrin repeat protein [Mizuhopecten yessoensis]
MLKDTPSRAIIQFQDHAGVQRLLQSGTSPNRQNVDDPVPLLTAMDNSDLHMVKLLLDHGPTVNIQDADGESPLHYATQDTVMAEVMEILLHAGADVNCLNKWTRTALHYVCYGGDLDKMELLLNSPGIRVKVQDEDGNTCLHSLMTYDEGENDDVEFWKRGLNMLLEAGVDVNITNKKGQTVLHMAAEHELQAETILSILLTKGNGFHFEVQDTNGNNFLLSYINRLGSDRQLLCKILKEECQSFHSIRSGFIKDIINMEAENGETPFLRFLFGSSIFDLEILQHFVRAGAEVNKPNSLGRTPLHRILMKELIENRLNVCKILLDGGAYTNAQDEFGLTPIFWARTAKQVGLICDAGADVTLTDKFGRNPLMNLTFPRTLEAAEELVVRGCSVNTVDMNGATPLHYAVWMNDFDLIEMLVTVGGDSSLPDGDNRTPLMLAEVLDHTKICEYLERQNLNTCNKEGQGQKEHVEIIYKRDNSFSREHWPGNQLTLNDKDIVKGTNIIDALEMQRYNGSVLAKQLLTRPGSGKLFDNPETTHVIDTVQRFVTKLSERISQRDPRFKNDIIQMGSMSEGTKTGYPDEFDFACCLLDILPYCEIENDRGPSHEGFVRMKLREESRLPNQMGSFFDRNGYFKTYHVRLKLFELVWDILLEKEMWQNTEILYVGDDETDGFDQMPVLNFQILWNCRIFKGLKISIDFVPAIRVYKSMADFSEKDSTNNPQEENALENGLLMLLHPPEEITPKTRDVFEIEEDTFSRIEVSHDNDLDELVKSRLRVSCAPVEVAFLDSLPKVTRESYILAKILKNECPKVRFDKDFFKELYDRDPLEIQRHEDSNFEPGEYDAYLSIVKAFNEASNSDDEENSLEIDVTSNTEQKAESKSLNISNQTYSSDDDSELHLSFGSSDNVEEQMEDAGCSPVDYLMSDDADHEEEDESAYTVFEANTLITSYMLKNALFHVIGKHPELCDPVLDQSTDEECWKITLDLTIQILEHLKDVSDTGEFPVYFLPRQNIFKFVYEFCRTMDQEEMGRRILSYGKRRNVFLNLILTLLRAP